jgi:hypothetical protein
MDVREGKVLGTYSSHCVLLASGILPGPTRQDAEYMGLLLFKIFKVFL